MYIFGFGMLMVLSAFFALMIHATDRPLESSPTFLWALFLTGAAIAFIGLTTSLSWPSS